MTDEDVFKGKAYFDKRFDDLLETLRNENDVKVDTVKKLLKEYINHQRALGSQIESLGKMHDSGLRMIFDAVEESSSWDEFKMRMTAFDKIAFDDESDF